jgi:hypothetical protein
MIATPYSWNDLRNSIADFPYLTPNGKLIAILSSPHIVTDTNILTIVRVFPIELWILIFISYLLLIFLNCLKEVDAKIKIIISIDYLVALIGKGLLNNHS